MKKLLTLINREKIIFTSLFLGFFGIFYTKAFDLGHLWLGLARQGEFLGFVVRLSDLILGFFLSFLILKFLHSILNEKLKQIKAINFILVLSITGIVLFWIVTNIDTLYSFKTGFLTYLSLLISTALIYKYEPKWLLILIPYFCFDHIFLSSTLVSLILLGLGYGAKFINSTSTKFINFTTLSLFFTGLINLFLANYQVFKGQSFGAYILGESHLDLYQIGGVAKQIIPFTDQVILRGYGLFPHPNILGFFGVACAIFGLKVLESNKYAEFHLSAFWINLNKALFVLSVFVVFISFSRMALISLIVIFLIYFVGKNIENKVFNKKYFSFWIFVILILPFSILLTSIENRFISDSYRIDQYQFWMRLTQKEPTNLILGVGLGQYPQHLKKSHITNYQWQNEPFYHPLGNILIEVGVLGFVITAVLTIKIYKKLQ